MAITGTPSNIISCSSRNYINLSYNCYALFINYYFINLRSRSRRQMLMLRPNIACIARKFILPAVPHNERPMPRDSHEYARVSAAARATKDEEGVGNGVRLDRRGFISRPARSPINDFIARTYCYYSGRALLRKAGERTRLRRAGTTDRRKR